MKGGNCPQLHPLNPPLIKDMSVRTLLATKVATDYAMMFLQGGSSIVKVPGEEPQARAYFFGLLVWPEGYSFLSILAWSRVYVLEILVKERSNFGNFCVETQNFGDFGPEKAKNVAVLT